jgi:hypothetical protein
MSRNYTEESCQYKAERHIIHALRYATIGKITSFPNLTKPREKELYYVKAVLNYRSFGINLGRVIYFTVTKLLIYAKTWEEFTESFFSHFNYFRKKLVIHFKDYGHFATIDPLYCALHQTYSIEVRYKHIKKVSIRDRISSILIFVMNRHKQELSFLTGLYNKDTALSRFHNNRIFDFHIMRIIFDFAQEYYVY